MSLSPHTSSFCQHIMSSITPLSTDILLGRGGNNFRHAGNDRLRKMTDAIAIVYHQATKSKKATMIDDMTQNLLREGVRFLNRVRPLGQPGYWEEADKDATRGKVSQELREAVKKLRKRQVDEQVSMDPHLSDRSIPRNLSEQCIAMPHVESSQSISLLRSFSDKSNMTTKTPPVNGDAFIETEPLPPSWDGSKEQDITNFNWESHQPVGYWEEADKDTTREKVSQELREDVEKLRKRQVDEQVSIDHPSAGSIPRNLSEPCIAIPHLESPQSKFPPLPRSFSDKKNMTTRTPVNGDAYITAPPSWDGSKQDITNFHWECNSPPLSPVRSSNDKEISIKEENEPIKQLFDEWNNE